MSWECCEIPISNNSSIIDLLNQQSCDISGEDETTSIAFSENKKSCFQHYKTSASNEHNEVSTLFNTTGRERNSTGPLKQWLFEHQSHPYPKESDKEELMKKTKMSAAQVTTWFTNARVKMRKENKLPLNISGKKKKKKQQEDFNHISQTLSPTDSSIIERSKSFDEEIFQSDNKRIVMAYSCLNIEQINELHRFVSLYPAQLSLSNCVDDCTTHLIVGNEEKPLLCPLTIKVFQSIARHLYVLTYRWIIECLKQNHIIDEVSFEIRGDIPFGEYHDGMKNSRLSKQINLFENCQFFILCNGCQDKMLKTELASLIQLCHGVLLDIFPLTTPSNNSVLTIVLCDKLAPFDCLNQQRLFTSSRSNGVHFLSPEWILESIIQFALQPFDSYEEKF